MESALKIGIILPQLEGLGSGHHADVTRRWTDLRVMARLAEDAGLDSIWVADHLLFRWPGRDEPQGLWEGWTLLSALAAATERVELGTFVACTIFRNPALLAKMADTLDEISGGRLVLGLGAGWHEPEFRAFGYPWDHRVSRFEEALQIIVPLLRTGRVDFEGRYYQARECVLRPRGPRPSGLPIMIGTMRGERMRRLAATYADLWNAYIVWGNSWPGAIPPLRKEVHAACRAVGRDPATLGLSVAPLVCFPEAGAGPTAPGETPLVGSTERLAEAFAAFAGEGISHLQVLLNPNTPAAVERLARVVEVLRHDRSASRSRDPRPAPRP